MGRHFPEPARGNDAERRMDRGSPEARRSRPYSRLAIGLLAGASVVVVGAFGLFAARSLIGERVAVDWLAARGVRSQVEIRSLSLTRLTARVRIGPPSDPDLTIRRLEVDYALTGPWQGQALGVEARAVRLWRPHLKGRLVDGRLSLGGLDRPLAELARAPPSAAPLPDVTVEQGVLDLATPTGELVLEGGGQAVAGAIVAVQGHLRPFDFALPGLRLSGGGVTFRVLRRGARLLASAEGVDLAATAHAETIHAGPVRLQADLPPFVAGRLSGAARVAVAAPNARVEGPDGLAASAAFQTSFDGRIEIDRARQSLTGRLTTGVRAAGVSVAGGMGRRATATLDLARFVLAAAPTGVSLSLAGQGLVEASGASIGSLGVDDLTSHVRLDGSVSAPRASTWKGDLALAGDLSAHGGVRATTARSLAAQTPVLGSEPSYQAALARALGAWRVSAPAWRARLTGATARFALAAPASIRARSGAAIRIDGVVATHGWRGASGSVNLALGGGGLPSLTAAAEHWSTAPNGLRADVALKGRLDALFAEGARLDLRGRVVTTGPRLRLDLAGCARVAAARLALGPYPITGVAGRICPQGAPLLEEGPLGWRAAARIEAAQGLATAFAAELTDASGDLSANGDSSGPHSVVFALDRGRIADTATPVRFFPVSASGRLKLTNGVWRGDFAAATPRGQPIASLRVTHDVATGVGRADIDARDLAFAPGSLQPADLTPLARFAKNVAGPAAFTGFFTWIPGRAPASGGELVARDLRFRSPAGAIVGLDANLHFSSLAPLVTVAEQQLSVRQIEGVAPLQGLKVVFDFDAQGARIEAAGAGFSGGQVRLEAMQAPFASGATLRGALDFDHVDFGRIVAASNLAERVKLQAVVDGRIPFEVGPQGVRIIGGRLAAVGPGSISIARATFGGGSSQGGAAASAQPGLAEDLAYQAMEHLAFDQLNASLNSDASDHLDMIFHVNGRYDPPSPQHARIALSDLLAGKALSKPLPLPSGTKINLTLDTTLNFGELVRALEQTWRESLGQTPQPDGSAPVQGAAASTRTGQ